jgi:hypothetical protein
LLIQIRPAGGTLTGLPTFFVAETPSSLAPRTLSGSDVTETVTITASELNWHFGDGATSGWMQQPRATHTYTYGGLADGRLASRWTATYTITYAGRNFGPYDVTGDVPHEQPFRLAVHHARPVLVR